MTQDKTESVRIDRDLLEKVKKIADMEKRSVKFQVEIALEFWFKNKGE